MLSSDVDFERARWLDERGEARHHGLMHGLSLRKLHSYPLPGTESESVFVEISREQKR